MELMCETTMAIISSEKWRGSTSLLKNTQRSVAEISYEIGFGSASYFIACFKKKFGCTPRAFREALRQK